MFGFKKTKQTTKPPKISQSSYPKNLLKAHNEQSISLHNLLTSLEVLVITSSLSCLIFTRKYYWEVQQHATDLQTLIIASRTTNSSSFGQDSQNSFLLAAI